MVAISCVKAPTIPAPSFKPSAQFFGIPCAVKYRNDNEAGRVFQQREVNRIWPVENLCLSSRRTRPNESPRVLGCLTKGRMYFTGKFLAKIDLLRIIPSNGLAKFPVCFALKN